MGPDQYTQEFFCSGVIVRLTIGGYVILIGFGSLSFKSELGGLDACVEKEEGSLRKRRRLR
jgi:hypothetical protein